MKTLPGLPILPTGHWWEVSPSSSGAYYTVELKAPNPGGLFPRVLGRGMTRSWPRPTVRSIVRIARSVHHKWLADQDRKAEAFVGKLVGR